MPRCFIMMPFSAPEGYAPGHFDRVYEFIIRPACEKAGFTAFRTDETNSANLIVADIVKEIIECDMAVCDLSTRNPNVMYELGIRHAFNKPVALIRDSTTPRIFDVQGLRDLEYDVTLRVDAVQDTVERLTRVITGTLNSSGKDITSPIQFLSVAPANRPEPTSLTPEVSLLLNAVSAIGDRISRLEGSFRDVTKTAVRDKPIPIFHQDAEGNSLEVGDKVLHRMYGTGIIANLHRYRALAIVNFLLNESEREVKTSDLLKLKGESEVAASRDEPNPPQ